MFNRSRSFLILFLASFSIGLGNALHHGQGKNVNDVVPENKLMVVDDPMSINSLNEPFATFFSQGEYKDSLRTMRNERSKAHEALPGALPLKEISRLTDNTNVKSRPKKTVMRGPITDLTNKNLDNIKKKRVSQSDNSGTLKTVSSNTSPDIFSASKEDTTGNPKTNTYAKRNTGTKTKRSSKNFGQTSRYIVPEEDIDDALFDSSLTTLGFFFMPESGARDLHDKAVQKSLKKKILTLPSSEMQILYDRLQVLMGIVSNNIGSQVAFPHLVDNERWPVCYVEFSPVIMNKVNEPSTAETGFPESTVQPIPITSFILNKLQNNLEFMCEEETCFWIRCSVVSGPLEVFEKTVRQLPSKHEYEGKTHIRLDNAQLLLSNFPPTITFKASKHEWLLFDAKLTLETTIFLSEHRPASREILLINLDVNEVLPTKRSFMSVFTSYFLTAYKTNKGFYTPSKEAKKQNKMDKYKRIELTTYVPMLPQTMFFIHFLRTTQLMFQRINILPLFLTSPTTRYRGNSYMSKTINRLEKLVSVSEETIKQWLDMCPALSVEEEYSSSKTKNWIVGVVVRVMPYESGRIGMFLNVEERGEIKTRYLIVRIHDYVEADKLNLVKPFYTHITIHQEDGGVGLHTKKCARKSKKNIWNVMARPR